MEEFDAEKNRLIAEYQRQKHALDSKGIFDSEINTIRAENMLLSAVGKISMVSMQRRAQEKANRIQLNIKTPEIQPKKSHAPTTMAEKLEKQLNDAFETSMRTAKDKEEAEEAKRREARMRMRRRASVAQPLKPKGPSKEKDRSLEKEKDSRQSIALGSSPLSVATEFAHGHAGGTLTTNSTLTVDTPLGHQADLSAVTMTFSQDTSSVSERDVSKERDNSIATQRLSRTISSNEEDFDHSVPTPSASHRSHSALTLPRRESQPTKRRIGGPTPTVVKDTDNSKISRGIEHALNQVRKKQGSTQQYKLLVEEHKLMDELGRILTPTKEMEVKYSISESMQKNFDNSTYPEDALIARNVRKKKMEKKYGQLKADSTAIIISPRQVAKGNAGDGVMPTAKQVWEKQTARIAADKLINKPSLVEAAGELKTINPGPLLPEVGSGTIYDIMNSTEDEKQKEESPIDVQTSLPENESQNTNDENNEPSTPPPIVSPTHAKFPEDLYFTERTDRAQTIAQREYMKAQHDSIVHNQQHLHPAHQLPNVYLGPNSTTVDDIVLSSDDSDSDINDDTPDQPAALSALKLFDKDSNEGGDHSSLRLLEDLVIFLSQEFSRKLQGKDHTSNDLHVMMNMLLQGLKNLLPYLEQSTQQQAQIEQQKKQNASKDKNARNSSENDPESNIMEENDNGGSAPRANSVFTEAGGRGGGPQGNNISGSSQQQPNDQQRTHYAHLPLITLRTLRSWSKGVETMLSWDLETEGPFNPNNNDHVGRLAKYYHDLYYRIDKRTQTLMEHWRSRKAIQQEQERQEYEDEVQRVLARHQQHAEKEEIRSSTAEGHSGESKAVTEQLVALRNKRKKDVTDYLKDVANKGQVPEVSEKVRDFLIRFKGVMQEQTVQSKSNKKAISGLKRFQKVVFDTMGVLKHLSAAEKERFLTNLEKRIKERKDSSKSEQEQEIAHLRNLVNNGFVNLFNKNTALSHNSRSEQKLRVEVLRNTDILAVITKYLKMASLQFQSLFRKLVLEMKHNREFRDKQVQLDDGMADIADSLGAIGDLTSHQTQLEQQLWQRLMEVERDQLIRKYTRDLHDKEDRVQQFRNLLGNTDVWSTAVRQGVKDKKIPHFGYGRKSSASSSLTKKSKFEQFQTVQSKLHKQIGTPNTNARKEIKVGQQEGDEVVRTPNNPYVNPMAPKVEEEEKLSAAERVRRARQKIKLLGVSGQSESAPDTILRAKTTVQNMIINVSALEKLTPEEESALLRTPEDTPRTSGIGLSQETIDDIRMKRMEELDTVWSTLKIEYNTKIGLYDKYDATQLLTLNKAVDLWKKASQCVFKRESILNEIFSFEAQLQKAIKNEEVIESDKEFQVHQEKTRAKLFHNFCKAGQLCEMAARKIELQLGDTLLYSSEPYLAKMQKDYHGVLSMLEQQRLATSVADVL